MFLSPNGAHRSSANTSSAILEILGNAHENYVANLRQISVIVVLFCASTASMVITRRTLRGQSYSLVSYHIRRANTNTRKIISTTVPLFPELGLPISDTAASKSSTERHFLPCDMKTDMSLTSFSDASKIRRYATGKAEPNRTPTRVRQSCGALQRVICWVCRKRELLTY